MCFWRTFTYAITSFKRMEGNFTVLTRQGYEHALPKEQHACAFEEMVKRVHGAVVGHEKYLEATSDTFFFRHSTSSDSLVFAGFLGCSKPNFGSIHLGSFRADVNLLINNICNQRNVNVINDLSMAPLCSIS